MTHSVPVGCCGFKGCEFCGNVPCKGNFLKQDIVDIINLEVTVDAKPGLGYFGKRFIVEQHDGSTR